MFEKLNLTINKGEKVLLEGDNGAGKSTFLKVLAGTWQYGNGHIVKSDKMMVLPQQIQIPKAKLSYLLQYSNEENNFSLLEMQRALSIVGLGYLSHRLEENKRDWVQSLSLGEQEKIGFARVLLNKPEVLCLDEATVSLSEDN